MTKFTGPIQSASAKELEEGEIAYFHNINIKGYFCLMMLKRLW